MDDYLHRLKERLVFQYEHIKKHQSTDPIQESAIKGYMEAGLVTGITSTDMLKAVIDQAHKKVFGVSFEQRQEPSLEADEAYYDIPTWIRKQGQ
ncbi:MAG: hypothetical protein RI556_12655 [Hydrogenovibrio sp.]|uniref:hypothetical protein n=1 Tax=Hydrogenovibrio sp. TaxID=2065821 RepID=UPI00286FF5D7|nr:hypothetical protein [Hydrogenovibrio sp.]MDR9500020.1 hypothetical protein [Hydrogenovibrio sp.]